MPKFTEDDKQEWLNNRPMIIGLAAVLIAAGAMAGKDVLSPKDEAELAFDHAEALAAEFERRNGLA